MLAAVRSNGERIDEGNCSSRSAFAADLTASSSMPIDANDQTALNLFKDTAQTLRNFCGVLLQLLE
jgi:hypothetical protein